MHLLPKEDLAGTAGPSKSRQPRIRLSGLSHSLLTALQEAGIRHVIVVDDGSGTQYASFFERAAAFENCEVLRTSSSFSMKKAGMARSPVWVSDTESPSR